ncbi:helix-turn-helix domain-containing protein [Sphingomonas sp. URHD0057]|uniref:helix-turn-helix domain-containing protein n=1 Tax=Sphingomonas sp. URHD0057 TaxID=1380389 RepID=UPI00048D8976|nr:helix-turn-helix transcriptional regulator [Sphingomonas sp. URHD0057]
MTPFGKALRKLRIDRELLLGDMAERLKISPSYLSQIETGKKPIPDGFVDKLRAALRLTDVELVDVRHHAVISTSEFKIQLGDRANANDKVLADALATEFARLSPDAKERIAKVINGGRGG